MDDQHDISSPEDPQGGYGVEFSDASDAAEQEARLATREKQAEARRELDEARAAYEAAQVKEARIMHKAIPEFDEPREVMDPAIVGLMDAVGLEITLSTEEFAGIFGKTPQWVYWVLRDKKPTRRDGTLIRPQSQGRTFRWTIPQMEDFLAFLLACGTLKPQPAAKALARIAELKRL